MYKDRYTQLRNDAIAEIVRFLKLHETDNIKIGVYHLELNHNMPYLYNPMNNSSRNLCNSDTEFVCTIADELLNIEDKL